MTQHVLATLTVRDFKRVSLVSIEPKRAGVTVLKGKNRQGKTSTLDAFDVALRGKASPVFPQMPVRAGAERAEIEVQFVDRVTGAPTLNVRRRFTGNGGASFKLSSPDPNQPQTQGWLDQFYGHFTVDPSEIMRMSSKQLAARLRDAMGIDTQPLDQARQDLFEERTAVGRERDRLDGAFKLMAFPSGPDEPVDVAGLLREHESMQATIAENTAMRRQASDAETSRLRLAQDVAELEAQLNEAKRQLAVAAETAVTLTLQAGRLSDPELEPIRQQIANSEATNKTVADRKAYRELSRLVGEKDDRYEQLTKEIAGIDEEKERMLAESRFPFPGVGIRGDMVMLNHVPIDQASGADRAEFIASLAIAQKPDMPVLLIRDGFVFDEDELEAFAKVAEKHGIQALIEKAGKQAEPGEILIEDGAVVEVAS